MPGMDFALSPEALALRDRARAYVVAELQPLEAEFERSGGHLPPEQGRELRRRAIECSIALAQPGLETPTDPRQRIGFLCQDAPQVSFRRFLVGLHEFPAKIK